MNKSLTSSLMEEFFPHLTEIFRKIPNKTWKDGVAVVAGEGSPEDRLFSMRFFVLGIEVARLWQSLFTSPGATKQPRPLADLLEALQPFFPLFDADFYLNAEISDLEKPDRQVLGAFGHLFPGFLENSKTTERPKNESAKPKKLTFADLEIPEPFNRRPSANLTQGIPRRPSVEPPKFSGRNFSEVFEDNPKPSKSRTSLKTGTSDPQARLSELIDLKNCLVASLFEDPIDPLTVLRQARTLKVEREALENDLQNPFALGMTEKRAQSHILRKEIELIDHILGQIRVDNWAERLAGDLPTIKEALLKVHFDIFGYQLEARPNDGPSLGLKGFRVHKKPTGRLPEPFQSALPDTPSQHPPNPFTPASRPSSLLGNGVRKEQPSKFGGTIYDSIMQSEESKGDTAVKQTGYLLRPLHVSPGPSRFPRTNKENNPRNQSPKPDKYEESLNNSRVKFERLGLKIGRNSVQSLQVSREVSPQKIPPIQVSEYFEPDVLPRLETDNSALKAKKRKLESQILEMSFDAMRPSDLLPSNSSRKFPRLDRPSTTSDSHRSTSFRILRQVDSPAQMMEEYNRKEAKHAELLKRYESLKRQMERSAFNHYYADEDSIQEGRRVSRQRRSDSRNEVTNRSLIV